MDGSSNQPRSGSPSDEDVLLASSNPKKPAGRKKFKETRHPVYRGIRLRNGNRWVCELRTPTNNSRIWLGSYPTAEMAARAHDVAALALRGRNACLNFADSAWRLPVPVSTETTDIQRAAAEAAELFRPPELAEPTQEDNVGVQNEQQYSKMNNNYYQPTHAYNVGLQNEQQYSGMNNNYYDNNVMSTDQATSSSAGYIDEEAMFNMPTLMDNMAEGLMLPPPRNPPNNNDNDYGGDDFSLWNF